MYWRAGIGFVALWIASLSLAMCGMAAFWMAGSRGAALCFLATAVVLAPPAQELISALRHRLAPPKAALYCCITLLPIGFGALVLDAVQTLEIEARKRGFASAGEWAHATDLKLNTAAELRAYVEAQQKAAHDRMCRASGAQPPIACYGAGHQRAALAFFDAQIGHEEMAAIMRDAVAQHRKVLGEADKNCASLGDRLETNALPVMLQGKETARAMTAAAWALHFNEKELDELVARAKPGVSYLSTAGADGLEKKVRTLAPQIERNLDRELQAWARRIVRDEPFWQTLLSGHAPSGNCTIASADAKKAQ